MIVKKVKNPKKSASKTVRVERLIDYLCEPMKENSNEKCIHVGTQGFITDKLQSQKAEMVSLSQEAVRSKDPINHYVLSWREGEQPSSEQADKAVSIFMDELGLKGHQVIYGLHADTANFHLHIVINRVHPETLKATEINRGFDIEAAHKAIARIEYEQGWKQEDNACYQVLENGDIVHRSNHLKSIKTPSQERCDMEQRTGEKSAERIAIEHCGPLIKQATSWQELHQSFFKMGMRYEKTGSGATIFIGEIGIKASSAHRDASLSRLQKRFGLYEPSLYLGQVVQHIPDPIKKDLPGWDIYISERKSYYLAKETDKLEQMKRHETERQFLYEQQRTQRKELHLKNWHRKGELLNAFRSVLAAEQASEKVTLRERHKKEREEIRKRYQPYPDLKQWLRLQNRPDLAEQWRYRLSEPQRTCGDHSDELLPTPRDIRAYIPEIFGNQVHYIHKDKDGVGYGVCPSFIDNGKEIEIYSWRNCESVLAALQLSAQKWGHFRVIGNEEYKFMCVQLAVKNGFKITNPELQESIAEGQRYLMEEKTCRIKSAQLKLFEQYSEAVGADYYRVTSVKTFMGGHEQVLILGEYQGMSCKFTSHEISEHMVGTRYLQRHGENIYYTPLSDKKHHILIGNMNHGRLERLMNDGYQPAVVLEASPGNYQAVITVAKLGTSHDREVGKQLSEHLNREYGDPKLSDRVHSHHAPGYENQDHKYRNEDGSYPEVSLVKAEHVECEKTFILSKEINVIYQRQVESVAQQVEVESVENSSPAVTEEVTSSGVHAFQCHYKDILKRYRSGVLDLSRIDSMIAVRLRATGYSQLEIRDIIRQCAPMARQENESRNWDNYAQRTASYAFGVEGNRQIAVLGKYRTHWKGLETQRRTKKEIDPQVGQTRVCPDRYQEYDVER